MHHFKYKLAAYKRYINYFHQDSKDVIELTDENFDKLVMGSEDMWLVEFYAPWCGHCKTLAPAWASAATQLKGKVKLGALDATVHTVKVRFNKNPSMVIISLLQTNLLIAGWSIWGPWIPNNQVLRPR